MKTKDSNAILLPFRMSDRIKVRKSLSVLTRTVLHIANQLLCLDREGGVFTNIGFEKMIDFLEKPPFVLSDNNAQITKEKL